MPTSGGGSQSKWSWARLSRRAAGSEGRVADASGVPGRSRHKSGLARSDSVPVAVT